MKKNISLITIVDFIVYGIIIGFIAYAKVKSTESIEAFWHVIREDGAVEYLTTLFLILAAVVLGINTIKAIQNKSVKKIVFNVLATLTFIFGAGEEISWGQRLFNVESSEYFMEKNYQGEMNLHNLEIGGVDLNILIFSQLMFAALIFYFVFLPILTYKTKFFRKLVLDFGVPIPRLHHTILLLATNSAIIFFINLKKESELHELALTGILFLVFLHPAKRIRELILNYKN